MRRSHTPSSPKSPNGRSHARVVLRAWQALRPAGLPALGAALTLTGLLLPQGWYETLPKPSQMPPEIVKGVTLLRLSLIIEGLALIWVAARRWTFCRLPENELLGPPPDAPDRGEPTPAVTYGILLAITALAAALRFAHLTADLWNDEIYSLMFYGKLPLWQVVATGLDSPNHLLNTFLVNVSIMLFGQTEWAIRLPAVLFGIATIPLMYWVGRFVLPRQAGLGAALLLSVSYQHLWFSQDARGYSPYLFFSLLGSGLFVKGLREDRPATWVLYVVTMVLATASLLSAGYVLVAHMIIGAAAAAHLRHQGRPPVALLKRLSAVFGAAVLLTFQTYATMLPKVLFYLRVWDAPGSGYPPLSLALLGELVRGAAAGLGHAGLVAAPVLFAVAGIGLATMLRRDWALTAALILPEILTVVLAAARGQAVAPRLLLLALPAGILAAIAGIDRLGELAGRGGSTARRAGSSRAAAALVIGASLFSAISLRAYYAAPKQPFQATIRYVQQQRNDGDIVLVAWLAGLGFEYYGDRYGLAEGRDYFLVRSAADVNRVLAAHAGKGSLFVTTLPRLIHLAYPDLEARVAGGWTPIRRIRGTLGGGDIMVWRQR